jgi:hypothetical protein
VGGDAGHRLAQPPQRRGGVPVQSLPGRAGNVFVHTLAQQVVPESQPVPRLGEHVGRECFLDRRQPLAGRASRHLGHFGHGEVTPEHGGHFQELAADG